MNRYLNDIQIVFDLWKVIIQESDSYRFIVNDLCPKKNRSLLFVPKRRERLKLNPNFVYYEQY